MIDATVQPTQMSRAIVHAESRSSAAIHCREASERAAEWEKRAKTVEHQIKGEIASAVGDDGKPVFSNAEKREAEFCVRCEADPELIAARAAAERERNAAARSAIEADFHRDMVSIYVAFAKAEGE